MIFCQSDSSSSSLFKQVATALCTFLSACLGRVPDALVRSKFANCSQVLMAVLERQQEQVLHKPCLTCIRTAAAFVYSSSRIRTL